MDPLLVYYSTVKKKIRTKNIHTQKSKDSHNLTILIFFFIIFIYRCSIPDGHNYLNARILRDKHRTKNAR
jgi:hypothetical protein